MIIMPMLAGGWQASSRLAAGRIASLSPLVLCEDVTQNLARHAGSSPPGNCVKIVLTLLVRDEADIIGSNLAYHLSQGVDFVIATDNGSRDGTDEILREYARHHPVEVLYEPPSDFSQPRGPGAGDGTSRYHTGRARVSGRL